MGHAPARPAFLDIVLVDRAEEHLDHVERPRIDRDRCLKAAYRTSPIALPSSTSVNCWFLQAAASSTPVIRRDRIVAENEGGAGLERARASNGGVSAPARTSQMSALHDFNPKPAFPAPLHLSH